MISRGSGITENDVLRSKLHKAGVTFGLSQSRHIVKQLNTIAKTKDPELKEELFQKLLKALLATDERNLRTEVKL